MLDCDVEMSRLSALQETWKLTMGKRWATTATAQTTCWER